MNIVSRSPAKRGRSPLAVIAASTAMALAMLASPAISAELGDIRRGQAHAEKVCAGCHAIGPNETASPRADATPFGVMSRVAGINERALTVFLQTPHSEMPNLIIVGQERDDLIAYILSLRGRP
jgi:cytochrome c2